MQRLSRWWSKAGRLGAGLMAAAGLASPALAQSPRPPLPPAELEAYVDGVMHTAMRSDHIAGAAVTVVQNDQVLLLKGYGLAQLQPQRPVDPERTLFRLASISKTFTWIAALRAVDDGRMSLTAPINTALPPRLQIPDSGRPVTLLDLMGHRPGFEERQLGRLFIDDPARLSALDSYLASDRPDFARPAGALPSYSNYGVALAGAAVAHVRGAPFEAVIEREIIAPLGMASTTFREPYPAREGLPAPMDPQLAGRLSQGFHWNGVRLIPQEFEYITPFAPAASVSSTAADMGRYMRALLNDGALNGRAIYGPKVAQALVTPLQPATPGAMAYLHGFRGYALPGGFEGMGHGGVTMSFLSNLVLVPELDLGIFITTNTETGRALAERLPGLIVGRFYAPAALAPKPADPQTAARGDRYAGAYLTHRRPFGGLESFAYRFGGVATVTVSKDGELNLRQRRQVTAYVLDPTAPEGVERFVARQGADRIVFTGQGARALLLYGPTGGEVFERLPQFMSAQVLAMLTLAAGLGALFVLATLWGHKGAPRLVRPALFAAAGAWVCALLLFRHWASAAQDSLVNTFTWPSTLPAASVAMWLCALASVVALASAAPLLRARSIAAPVRLGWLAAALLFLLHAALLAAWGGLTFWRC